MADEEFQQDQGTIFASEMGTRINDLEQKTNSLKERLLLLGNNLIEEKEETEKELSELKKENNQLKRQVEQLTNLTQKIVAELDKFTRKEDSMAIERMLRDFQPLEFMRKKDVEELLKKR